MNRIKNSSYPNSIPNRNNCNPYTIKQEKITEYRNYKFFLRTSTGKSKRVTKYWKDTFVIRIRNGIIGVYLKGVCGSSASEIVASFWRINFIKFWIFWKASKTWGYMWKLRNGSLVIGLCGRIKIFDGKKCLNTIRINLNIIFKSLTNALYILWKICIEW